MNCAWQEFLHIVPLRMRTKVDTMGRDTLQELRLRLGQPPELVLKKGSVNLPDTVQKEDLAFSVNTASQYSPWSADTTAEGYLTGPGGHRIGLCGRVVMHSREVRGIREPTSLCLRVARDFPGIAKSVNADGSVLIVGKPGSGKTTLLRDLIRKRSEEENECVAVVDERGELFPYAGGRGCFPCGRHTDILTGCDKPNGITMALRTMSPSCIAVDEITAQEDAEALIAAAWCGVDLFATAHAAGKEDLYERPIYRTLLDKKLFRTLIIMGRDKSWRVERMGC